MNQEFEQLSLRKAVVLHLFPGAIVLVIFVLLATLLRPLALPALFWLVIAVPLGLIPSELGYLLYMGKQKNGRYSLEGILAYQRPLRWVQYLWMVVAAFFGMLVLFTVAGAADGLIFNTFFGWWPAWLNVERIDFVALGSRLQILLFVWTTVFVNMIGPTVEEIYFRGYLLPRLSHFGRWSNLINTFLFALYHLWTPWHLLQRTIGALPLAIGAKHGNLRVAIITHVLVNTIGFTLSILGTLSMAQ